MDFIAFKRELFLGTERIFKTAAAEKGYPMRSTKAAVCEYRWTGKIAHGAGEGAGISVSFFICSNCKNTQKEYENADSVIRAA